MKLAFFGGTFDPPHLGHLAVAQAVMREYSLDRLLVAPTARQPLKAAAPVAGYADRLAMVGILVQDLPGAEASGIEAPRPQGEPNFTIDTLARLRAMYGADARLFVVTGADAFLGLRQWREPDRLLEEAEWVVVSRPEAAPRDFRVLGLSPDQQRKVHTMDSVDVPVSATEVRARMREGRSIEGLVLPGVLAYIHAHHLYEGSSSSFAG